MRTSEDPRMGDPSFRNGYSSGVLASADLGTQVLVAQMQRTMDQQANLLEVMQETLHRLEELGALFREAEAGSPYWHSEP